MTWIEDAKGFDKMQIEKAAVLVTDAIYVAIKDSGKRQQRILNDAGVSKRRFKAIMRDGKKITLGEMCALFYAAERPILTEGSWQIKIEMKKEADHDAS